MTHDHDHVPVPREQAKNLIAWMFALAVSRWVMFWAVLVDILTRAGHPLVMELHTATIVWLGALAFYRFSGWYLKRASNRIVRQAARQNGQ